ncbi:MAG: glycosyltransferase family A protein [Nitrospirota bacterium]
MNPEDLSPVRFVSVVVPVYNDAGRIGRCIEALLNQTYPADQYEIIVVDNGSTDNTREVVKQYPVALLIEDKIRSSYGARNTGIRNAKGDIVALTDSDCMPRREWLEKGVANLLRDPNCGLVAGDIEVFFTIPGKPNAVEIYDSINGFNQKEDIETRNYGSTANVFTFRKIFYEVGFFNDHLRSGGDNEWGRRIFACGYGQIYAKDTIVGHPARDSFGQLYRRTARLIGGCYEQYWKNSFSAYITGLIRSFRNPLAMTVRILLGMYPADRLQGITKKMQYLLVTYFVETVGIYERSRLLLGGTPKR